MVAIPASLVALQLSNHAEQLACELFPDAKHEGNELRWHGLDGAIWSMRLRGDKRGIWCNWANFDAKGDALELVHYALFPAEQGRRESVAWAARWLGLDQRSDLDPARALELRRLAVEALERRALEQREWAEKKGRQAVAIYLDNGRSQPLPLCPEIASYLRVRGAPLEELSGIPRALRFTASMPYDRRLDLPAMLAPVIDPMSGRHIATHVTFLRQDNAGHWRKAEVKPAKKVFGGYAGGVIPLLRGASGKPLAQAPAGDTILIAEGIENALAASLVIDGDPRVLACVSVGNLPGLELPEAFTTVILAYDRDGENEAVRRARERAKARFKAEGRSVRWIKPPVGHKDFSDYLVDDAQRGFVA